MHHSGASMALQGGVATSCMQRPCTGSERCAPGLVGPGSDQIDQPHHPRHQQPSQHHPRCHRACPRPGAHPAPANQAFRAPLRSHQGHHYPQPHGTGIGRPCSGPIALHKRRACVRTAAQGAWQAGECAKRAAHAELVGKPPRCGGHRGGQQQPRAEPLQTLWRAQLYPTAVGCVRAARCGRVHRRPAGAPCSTSRSSTTAPSAKRRRRTAATPDCPRCPARTRTQRQSRGSS